MTDMPSYLVIVAPNEVGNYSIFGSVYLSVCLSVCMSVAHFFRTWNDIGIMVFCNMVGYRSGMEPIDVGVIPCTLEVKGQENLILDFHSYLHHVNRH